MLGETWAVGALPNLEYKYLVIGRLSSLAASSSFGSVIHGGCKKFDLR